MSTSPEDTATGFSVEERTAMKQRAAELRKPGRGNRAAADEAEVLAKIEKMSDADRAIAARIHALVAEAAPDLAPKLWYGQPAYARNGKVVCFFRSGSDDKERYSTFGFTPEARIDDDSGVWATSFAVAQLTPKAEKAVAALVAGAAG